MKTKKVSFRNTRDYLLSARLELPANGHPRAYALFAHCFTCNKNFNAVRNISRALSEMGYGVLRFDFTGLGESEGSFADSTFTANVEDLMAAASFLEREFEAPSLILGHSLGGAAAIFAGDRLKSIKAVCTIGAPSDPAHVQHLLSQSLDQIKLEGAAEVSIGGRPFIVEKAFIDDLKTHSMQRVLNKGQKALLIMHSPQDEVVPVSNAAEIYKAARHPKSFISLDGADHMLSDSELSIYAANMICSWADRYLPKLEEQDPEVFKQVAVSIGSEDYTCEIKTENHGLLADEPKAMGGKDLGPSPYEYLLGALGSCTAMTLRMYARRKKWDLEGVVVHLSHSREHPSDCENCDDKMARIDVIEKLIEMEGDLDIDQRARLMEIAEKCPVNKTLLNAISIRSEELIMSS